MCDSILINWCSCLAEKVVILMIIFLCFSLCLCVWGCGSKDMRIRFEAIIRLSVGPELSFENYVLWVFVQMS